MLADLPAPVTVDTQPPVDDDEARFDDESSAVGRPAPLETAPLEDASKGSRESASKHDGSFRGLIRAARWVRRDRRIDGLATPVTPTLDGRPQGVPYCLASGSEGRWRRCTRCTRTSSDCAAR